jgi:uncharacterized protein with HEPN domain
MRATGTGPDTPCTHPLHCQYHLLSRSYVHMKTAALVAPPLHAAALREILFHVHGVRDMLQGVTVAQFSASYPMTCSVERATTVIGANINTLPADLLPGHPKVDWSQVVAFGAPMKSPEGVSSELRWRLATSVIPGLEGAVTAMLNSIAP